MASNQVKHPPFPVRTTREPVHVAAVPEQPTPGTFGVVEVMAIASQLPLTLEPLIQKTPDVVGGEARIRNTRIPVWSLVHLRKLGMKDREIRGNYTIPLTADDLKAAWDYYERNRAEIDRAIQENEAG